ncbi:MAG: hypothetical protein A3C43_03550 [Candidatus Schekmanbacteria bacterium RIFCSPHIGHO2_02_FULL_38_11]|nr:MAG: hypothetical protein A3C43_03550 [Candidatus Schekmanbacteria bacterium RIFCSPHIGHO2_02_FULL_38_11]
MPLVLYKIDANVTCLRCGNTMIARDGKGRESSLFCYKCGYRIYYYTIVREMERNGIKILTCLKCDIDFFSPETAAFYCPRCKG